MHNPTYRIAHTMALVTQVVEHWLEREIAQWIHPMKDRSDDPSHRERTLLLRSYISLPGLASTRHKLKLVDSPNCGKCGKTHDVFFLNAESMKIRAQFF